MAYTLPTYTDFQTQFARDFSFGTDLDHVQATDFAQAQTLAVIMVPQTLIGSQALYSVLLNLVTAHHLALAIQASSQGLGSQGAWLTQQKSAGDLREAYAIPLRIRNSPQLAGLSRTQYGCQYLQAITSRAIANYTVVPGGVLP